MIDQLINRLQKDPTLWVQYQHHFQEINLKPKTVLLNAGEISQQLFFIKKGCLRLWFNNEGRDITFQFFFENQAVSSLESYLKQIPSQFSLESIEPSIVTSLSREGFELLNQQYPDIKDKFQEILIQRLANYTSLFLSRIKDTPQERYNDLLINHPEIIKRIPQHYIASYLGITPISLSRIRNRK